MKGWLILGIILLCLWLIGRIGAKVELIYNGALTLRLKVLGLTLARMPKKERKPIDPDDFSPVKYRKLLAKEAKKQAKKAKKQAQKAQKKKSKKATAKSGTGKPKKSPTDVLDLVYTALDALRPLGRSFGKHFEIEAVRLRITVGSEDAAQTALLYGILSQAVAYALEIVSNSTNLRIKEKNRGNILVDADFTSEKIAADLHLIFKLRVWHLLAMLFSALGGVIKNRLAGMKGQSPAPAVATDRTVGKTNSENT